MMKNRTSIFDRVLALALCAVLVLGMMPTGVSANDSTYGTVSAISGTVAVSGNSSANVVATVSAAELDWVDVNSQGRTEGWWAGVLVTAPDSLEAETATISYGEQIFKFKDCKDAEDQVGLWLPVTVEDVEKGNVVSRTYTFDWNGDGEEEQTLTVKVDAGTLTLNKDGVKVAPLYAEVVGISGTAEIVGSGEKAMTATVNNAVLEFVEANDEGRTEGWWAGVMITAPANYADNAKIKYDDKDFDFAACRDTENEVGLWLPVTTIDVENGAVVSRTYSFDWNGDGNYEQTLVFNANAGTFTLNKNGAKVCPLYGTVAEISGSTMIDGSGTKYMSAVITAAELDWVGANDEGRTEGWWAGVMITAPANYSADAKVAYGSEVFNFADCKDTENEVGLWLPVSNENLENGTNPNRLYSFDWNGDGNYEQALVVTVHLSDKIVLTKDGKQVYPAYGSVSALTPNTMEITGNGTAQTSAVAENATLTWVPADPSVGRDEGWWAGIRVTAPATGFVPGKAQYAYVDGNGTIGAGKSFDTYKDGENFIQMWMPVSAESLANDADRFLTLTYAFDWNGNGGYEQKITFRVNADGTTLLDQNGYQIYPALVGSVSSNVGVVENNNTANVTVNVDGQTIVWDNGWKIKVSVTDPTNPAKTKDYSLSFEAAGDGIADIEFEIDWDGNDHIDQVIVLTGDVKLEKAEQTAPTFEKGNSVNLNTGDFYAGYLNAVNNVAAKVGALSYAIESEYLQIDANTGVITVKDGQWGAFLAAAETQDVTATVTATFAETDTHKEISSAYTLTVGKNPDTSLKFENEAVQVTYGAKGDGFTYTQVPVSESGIGYSMAYVSSNTDVATVDAEGKVTFHKAGETVITVTATYNAKYTVSSASYTLTIVKGDQAALVFGTSAPDAVIYQYNGTFSNAVVSGGNGTGKVTYTIEGDAATIDPNTGVVSYIKAGTVTITATKAGDDCYNPISETYTLTINKADQVISQSKTEDTVVNDTATYDVSALLTKTEHCVSTAPFVFAITDKSDTMADTTIDAETGVLAIGALDYGTVTVKITRAGDDCFNAMADKSFTLTVKEMETEPEQFVITGAKIPGAADPDWFSGDVTIEYIDDLDYQVSLHGSHGWNGSYLLTTEGVNNIALCVLKGEHDGSKHNATVPTIKIDKTAPGAAISYTDDVWGEVLSTLTFGYYNATMKVTIAATDAESGSGLYAIHYSVDGGETWVKEIIKGYSDSVSFRLDPQYRNQIKFYAEDMAGNTCEVITGTTTIIVDNVNPVLTPAYTYDRGESTDPLYYEHNGIYYTQYNTNVSLTITEANFDRAIAADADRENLESAPVVKIKNTEQEQTWVNVGGDDWQTDLDLTEEDDYILNVTFSDKSKNEMTPYTQEIRIDRTKPVITLEEDLDRKYTNENIATVVTITEHNFDPAKTVITVSGEDIEHKVVVPAFTYDVEWHHDGDVHTAVVELDQDAIYSLKVESTDLAGNVAEVATARFILDKTAPVNVQFSYDTPVLEKILEGITFGYYQAKVQVTVTAEDMTSMVKSFELTYTRKDDDSDEHVSDLGHVSASNLETKTLVIDVNDSDIFEYSNQAKTATATFTLEASELEQFFGSVSVVVTDWTGNACEVVSDNDDVVIVDNIAPVAEPIAWDDAKEVLEAELTVGELTRPAATRYYDEKAVATVTIKEANFYGEEVVITDKGETVAFDGVWKQTAQDVWVNTVTLTEEGDHELEVSYVDRSGNVMNTVVSELIVIDHTNPVISVDRDDAGVRHYYKDAQTVNVTIVEHNFREADAQFVIIPKNSSDDVITLNEIDIVWTHAGDEHTATFTLAEDANYTVDVEYADLSLRQINDLPAQLITVDKVAPSNLKVEYSRSLVDHILNGISFGFYNAPVTVTISAEDDIAGIDRFDYSYILNEHVSAVNAELLDQVIVEDIKQEGNVFTAEFKIPESVLVNTNQFNGYVEFAATDRSGWKTVHNEIEGEEKRALIVDNINPTSDITYNEPVRVKNDVAYYDGEIDAIISITEANFFAQDVNVYVTKDGARYPVQVAWHSNNVNNHVGNFTLTEDGDYVVQVVYADRSTNAMATYTSQQLTIDTKAPAIGVTKVVNDSANTDSVYSFEITASDINFDTDAFHPALTALVRNEDGSFVEKKIDLGAMKVLEEGNTYSFLVENLEEDAIYFLTCTVTDLSGNTSNQMLLEDGKHYTTVRFSINRNGSTFLLSEYTRQLVNDFYNRNVIEDLVIIEINADVLDEHKITLNGKDLTEGTDYTVKSEGGNGKWMQYTYTVNKSLFEAEGEYQLVVSSKDKAGNYAFSDVKDATIGFVVDRTAPVVSVVGMANDGRYQTEIQTVTLIPTDDGGALNYLLVRLVDEDGQPLQTLIELTGEELINALENGDGRLTFELGEGLYQNVQIICEDSAVSEEGPNVYDETFKNLSVSTSGFMIFWANKPLRWGVIGGSSTLLALIIFLVTKKKRI